MKIMQILLFGSKLEVIQGCILEGKQTVSKDEKKPRKTNLIFSIISIQLAEFGLMMEEEKNRQLNLWPMPEEPLYILHINVE